MTVKRVILLFSLIYIIPLYIFAQASEDVLIDQIVAVVDDEIILFSELEFQVQDIARQQRIDPSNTEKFAELRQYVLNELINQKILLAKAKEDTVTIADDVVEDALNSRISELTEQLGSEEALENQFKMSIRKIKKFYRETIRNQMMIEQVQRFKFFEITVSRREVEKFYKTNEDNFPELKEAVNISHILKEPIETSTSWEAALQRARKLLERLRQGEDFAELARNHSDGPSAKNGGDLGTTNRGDFVPEYEKAAFLLKEGEISEPVRSQFGYHIIQLLERIGEKIHTRHILISTPKDFQAVLDTLNRIRHETLEGKTTFEEAALKYSEDEEVKGKESN